MRGEPLTYALQNFPMLVLPGGTPNLEIDDNGRARAAHGRGAGSIGTHHLRRQSPADLHADGIRSVVGVE